jgi:hypothetical protein
MWNQNSRMNFPAEPFDGCISLVSFNCHQRIPFSEESKDKLLKIIQHFSDTFFDYTKEHIDVIYSKQFKIKYCAYRHHRKLVFVVHLWRGTDGEMVIEMNRRQGCCLHFSDIYRHLLRMLMNENLIEQRTIRYKSSNILEGINRSSDLGMTERTREVAKSLVDEVTEHSILSVAMLSEELGVRIALRENKDTVPKLLDIFEKGIKRGDGDTVRLVLVSLKNIGEEQETLKTQALKSFPHIAAVVREC